MGVWVRVCLLWDMGLNTHIARKSTLNFTTSLSLVLIKLILGKMQPFENSKFYYEMYAGRDRRFVWRPTHFLVKETNSISHLMKKAPEHCKVECKDAVLQEPNSLQQTLQGPKFFEATPNTSHGWPSTSRLLAL